MTQGLSFLQTNHPLKISHLRKFFLSLTILLLLGMTSISTAANAPSAGTGCSQAGQRVFVSGKKMTCKLIWVTTSSVSAPTKKTASTELLTDKLFRLESISFTNDFTTGAHAHITNISSRSKTAISNISIFASDGKTVVTSLTGSAQSVTPGQTVTVDFVGIEGLPSSNFKYAFQVTIEM